MSARRRAESRKIVLSASNGVLLAPSPQPLQSTYASSHSQDRSASTGYERRS
jgi:hypothetical protein